MKSVFGHGLVALCIGWAGVAAAQGNSPIETNPNKIPHRINPGNVDSAAPTAGGTAPLSAISWHGGPVIGGAPEVHLIWYGNWNQGNGSDTPAGQQIVADFMSSLSNTNYLKINTGYTGSGSTAVSGTLGTVKQGSVGYLKKNGQRLRDSDISSIVSTYVSQQAGGAQANAVYFVLTSSDVNETSGFCTKYCGWHTKGAIGGVSNVKYSFVGNANRCLSGCAAQTVGPNGNAGVDGMISVVAHELVEALSDPELNAWYDASGAENADKCAWTFGQNQQLLPSGAYYNLTLGARNYLIQRNLATNSKCYMDLINGLQ